MPFEYSNPFITSQSVLSALDTLTHSPQSKASTTPLQHLSLVDDILLDPDFPSNIPQAREYAVQHLLVQRIMLHLQQLCSYHQVPTPSADASLDLVENFIVSVGAIGNEELTGWCWLYCEYVVTSLPISATRFSELVHVDDRTRRRYKASVIEVLTRQLIQSEWHARTESRKRRILAELPALQTRQSLMEREPTLQVAKGILENQSNPRIIVSGTSGVGKTAFVQLLARTIINEDQVDFLIWIDRPPSIKYVYDLLFERLSLLASRHVTVRERLLIHNVLVVIDHGEHLASQMREWNQLLDFLEHATVIITESDGMNHIENASHVWLDELSRRCTLELVDLLFEQQYPQLYEQSLSKTYGETIWRMVGGNPLAIQLLFSQLIIGAPENLRKYAAIGLVTDTFTKLTKSQQQALYLLTWCVGKADAMSSITELVSREDIHALSTRHLVDVQSSDPLSYTVSTTVANSLQHFYEHQPETQAAIGELFEGIEDFIAKDRAGKIGLLEGILQQDWLIWDERLSEWVELFRLEIPAFGDLAIWRTILERYLIQTPAPNLEIRLVHGVVLRKLSAMDEANSALNEIIKECGKSGNFSLQLVALLELAILLRLQGEYAKALQTLQTVEGLQAHYQVENLGVRLVVEKAQIHLDQKNPLEALATLETLDSTSDTEFIRCEAYLQLEQYASCRELATQQLAKEESLTPLTALHSIMGRCYAGEGEFDMAVECLGTAHTLLEKSWDVFALARTKTDFAGALIELFEFEKAERLLQGAEEIQRRIRDRVGLAATKHNQILLKSRIKQLLNLMGS